MRIVIETIPHHTQRYETVGDWFWDGETLQIRVSKMSDWKREMAVAEHEMSEALWCLAAGVDPLKVDKFDKDYEANRKDDDFSEPGDSPDAPYFEGHQLGTAVEKQVFAAWNWAEYDKEVMDL